MHELSERLFHWRKKVTPRGLTLLKGRGMHMRTKLCLGIVLPSDIFQGLGNQRGIAWLSQVFVEAIEGERDQVSHFAF